MAQKGKIGNRGGRKPKPVALKRLEGNRGKRVLPEEDDVLPLPANIPAPPEELGALGKKKWAQIAPQLYALGLLRSLDVDALGLYCELYERRVKAEAMIKRLGMTSKTPNGYRMLNPLMRLSAQCLKDMKSILTEFGMTPSSRRGITAHIPQAPGILHQPQTQTSEPAPSGDKWEGLIPQ